MDNISKIAANANFYVQSGSVKKGNDDKKAEEKQPETVAAQNEAKDPDAIFDAMQMSAIQNKAIAFGKFINPRDYLSEDRIKDIEASMGTFAGAAESAKAQMDVEFKGVSAYENLSDAQKLAMAASMQIAE
ncbi:TPA: hypothetical protein IAA68_00800 [Candidatus Galligastranaerophilus faecipullorum]|nr:hypothetical protein [Candidatus Galligastranaerophilus faecipullorum]